MRVARYALVKPLYPGRVQFSPRTFAGAGPVTLFGHTPSSRMRLRVGLHTAVKPSDWFRPREYALVRPPI
eukprot:8709458-Pyramimonas_sp.AAC.1